MIVELHLDDEQAGDLGRVAAARGTQPSFVLDILLGVLLVRYGFGPEVRFGNTSTASLVIGGDDDVGSLCARLRASVPSAQGEHLGVQATLPAQGGGSACLRGRYHEDSRGRGMRWSVTLELPDRAAAPTADRASGHLRTLLGQVLARPDVTYRQLEILTPAERAEIRFVFNDTDAPRPAITGLDAAFREQAVRDPQAAAVIVGDYRWTYGDLARQADALAARLHAAGVVPGSRVGVLLERSPEVISAMLAIWQARGTYFPLEPAAPPERLARFITKGAPAALITDREELVAELGFGGPLLHPRDSRGSAEVPVPDQPGRGPGGDHPAGLFFTSGSTGDPKGVLIRHAAIHNGLLCDQKQFGWGPGDVFLFKSSLSFIASMFETVSPLLSGASVVVLPPGAERDVEAVVQAVEVQRVTHIVVTPGFLDLFLEYVRYRQLWSAVSSLRVVFATGEALGRHTVSRFNHLLHRQNGTRLYNTYGLTETSVDVTCADCSSETWIEGSIGKPIDNVRLYVLDACRRLQPVGIPGTLWVAGDHVLADPLDGDDDRYEYHPELQERLFHTRDRVAWLPDGSLQYLGRQDAQVQIRGFRVEPAEVEQALMADDRVNGAAVVVSDDRLYGFAVPRGGVTEAELQQNLASRLADYMLPAAIFLLDRLPLNHHGKVDRACLRQRLEERAAGRERRGPPPADAWEERLHALWAELLGAEAFGTTEDFFELGGTSLTAVLLQIRIHQQFNVEIPLGELFPRINISRLARMVREASPGDDTGFQGSFLSARGDRVLHCFPPVAGFGVFYQDLAASLAGHSVYAFDFVGHADFIQSYVTRILRVQGSPPYTLLGYSAGACVAFEVARALEGLGLEVENLVLVAGHRQDRVDNRTAADIEAETQFLYREVVLRDFSAYIAYEVIRKRVLERIRTNLRFMDRMVNEGSVAAPLYVIRPEAGPSGAGDDLGWRTATSGAYKEYQGRGEHERMLHGEDAAENFALIEEILQGHRSIIGGTSVESLSGGHLHQ